MHPATTICENESIYPITFRVYCSIKDAKTLSKLLLENGDTSSRPNQKIEVLLFMKIHQ